MKPTVKLAVPSERAEQMRQLAVDLGNVSMSATFAALFKAARETGLIRNLDLPGVDVHALSDGVMIRFDQGASVPFTFNAASALAATVRQFASGANDLPFVSATDHNFTVRRKGNGIIVEITTADSTEKKSFNSDLANEFCELLEYAVAKKGVK